MMICTKTCLLLVLPKMDDDEKREALEDAGIDVDDYDDFDSDDFSSDDFCSDDFGSDDFDF